MVEVSVIIPAYNSESHLKNAIDSALAQTFQNLEILVIDDGSTDSTRAIVQEYESKYPGRIRYFYQENRGPAAARNRGLKEARGEYIAFLDADDVWLPEKLGKQIALVDKTPDIGFVYCDNYFTDANGEIIENYVRDVKLLRGDILLDLFCNHFLMTPAVIIRKTCIDTIGYFREDYRVGEDYEFFLRLARAYKADYSQEKLWKRIVSKDSLSRQNYRKDANNDLVTLTRFIADNQDFFKRHKQKITQRLAGYHFSFGYRLLEDGHNGSAFIHFIRSLRYRVSVRTLKNVFLCLIPNRVRQLLKGKRCLKSV